MRVLNCHHGNFANDLDSLLDRNHESDKNVEGRVAEIILDVRQRGDEALIEYTQQYDAVDVAHASELLLSKDQILVQCETLDEELKQAIQIAADRIRNYHQKEVHKSWKYQEHDGTTLGQKISPIDNVGVYVPGGKASYPSSVLMTVIPAKVAGVKQVTMVVPTPEHVINPAVLFSALTVGVDHIYTVGGAQAIAALAYGTETIQPVDKIVGPGNIYVATAKKQVFGKVGIDMIAGPSEVVVICDDNANPDWVAMDLFAQAEHDELAQSIAITDSEVMVKKIQQSIQRLLPTLERHLIIEKALERQGAIIKVNSLEQAAEIADRIAPEHLELMIDDPERLSERINHAGAIFIGRYSAESLGDYCAGPNHVLPTAGTARFSSPLGVYDFQKRSSLIFASQAGAHNMAQTASILARCEGLTAHARSAEFRISD